MMTDRFDSRQFVKERILAQVAAWANGMTLAEIRRSFEAFLDYPADAQVSAEDIGGMPACWIAAPETSALPVTLFCHGGGFQIGSTRSHRNLMARLSAATGGKVLGIDYRLAPEHRFPAAAEDAFAAYRWLLDRGIAPQAISVAGDSAGGSLALGVALQAREADLELAACIVLISPWLDLAMRGDSYISRAAVDIFSRPEQLRAMARTYLGRDGDPLAPLASPFEADLGGLPPILVHAGDCDITRDDSVLLAGRAREQGVPVEIKVWDEMGHHFQVFPELPEAEQSLAGIGVFIRRHTKCAA